MPSRARPAPVAAETSDSAAEEAIVVVAANLADLEVASVDSAQEVDSVAQEAVYFDKPVTLLHRPVVAASSAAPRRSEYSYRPWPAGGHRPAVQRHRCGRPRGSVSRAVALHCKSTAPGAVTVQKEPYSRTLPGDGPVSFRRAGRSWPRAGRPRPALHPDGTTACPRPGARRRRLTKGSALSTTHRSLAAACSAARRRAAMAGSCCPSATATETRRCPTTRARPFRGRMDDCIRSRRPASRDARRACRGTGEPLLRASKAAR